MLESLLKKKLLLVSGKGGTGKSLVSCMLAKEALRNNKKVLLIESSTKESASMYFGHSPVGHSNTEIDKNFFCVNLDPRYCFEEYVVKHLGYGALYEKVFKQKVVRSFFDAMPGLAETMLLGRIYYSVCLSPENFDLVIYDAPASWHFLQLMTTPDAVLQTDIGGPLVREVRNVHNMLSNSEQTGAVYVTLPEDLVLSETTEFIQKIGQKTPIQMDALICNRSYFDRDTLNEFPDSFVQSMNFVKKKIQSSLGVIKKLDRFLQDQGIGEEVLHFIPDFGALSTPLQNEFTRSFWTLASHRTI